jgi:hypothetical protein
MEEKDFQAGKLSIRYMEDHPDLMVNSQDEAVLRAAAVTAALLEEGERGRHRVVPSSGSGTKGFSDWRRAGFPFRGRK